MSVPKYYEMHKPFLLFLEDGDIHSLSDLKKKMIQFFGLSDKDLIELLPSGRQTIFDNRIGWARTYLKKAGLIASPSRAHFKITDEGLSLLEENPVMIDDRYLMRYESFRLFQNQQSSSTNNKDDNRIIEETPDDTFEDAFNRINERLIDDLLAEVSKISPWAFEQLVIDLLHNMGYGAFETPTSPTSYSNDEGIDGIIMEDKLGFNLIYIQAKKWDLDRSVGRPDIQAFVGAISGKGGKGLFVTTARFSKHAIDYANHQHIILIDGHKLAKLMIEHNFGVSVKKSFDIKVIDTDIFNQYT